MLRLIVALTLLTVPAVDAQVSPPPRPAKPLTKTIRPPKDQLPGADDLLPLWGLKGDGPGNLAWTQAELARTDRLMELQWAQRDRQEALAADLAERQWTQQEHAFDLMARQATTLDQMRIDGWSRSFELPDAWSRFDSANWQVPPGKWSDDPADSLYRQARELLNRGEWRKAVATFRDIAQKFPNSSYLPDALYWQAFALYRIGGGTDLRQALELLDAHRTKYPNARTQGDASALATRIRGALAARGDASAAAQIARTASDSTQACDQEDMSVRAEALSALAQSDAEGASQLLQRVLSRRDACSALLRRNAIFILANKWRDPSTTTALIQAAKSDPSVEVRAAAIEWLARLPGEEALSTLEDLSRNADDERIQRTAVRALVMHPSDKARQLVRTIIERSETPERLRFEALGAFEKERVSADDITWLRNYYARTDDQRMKQRLLYTLGRVGGPEVDQWFLSLARNADESSEVRTAALRRVGKSMAIAELAKVYDNSSERRIREELIGAFANRPEDEATDKLIDIVKTGTDPNLRRMAINALSRKKDPRTMKFLLDLVEK